jgi:hypothetical protein
MTSYNITPEQGVIESLNLQASMWANRIMTRKLSNQQCKYEIAQQVDDVDDMQTRVRKYLNAGLVTNETYAPKIDNSLARLREAAKSKPIEHKAHTGGSKDGLWSTDIRGKR